MSVYSLRCRETKRCVGDTSAQHLQQASAGLLLRQQQVIEDGIGWFDSRAAANKRRSEAARVVLHRGRAGADVTGHDVDHEKKQRCAGTKRRGGPWRAFMSQYWTMCRAEGMQLDITAFAAEYQAIKDAQDDTWEELSSMGKLLQNSDPKRDRTLGVLCHR